MNETEKKLLSMAATLQLSVYNGIVEGNVLVEPPISFCSGCIYKNFILSVLHGCPKQPNQLIVASASVDSEGRTLNQILNPQFMTLGKITEEGILTDFKEVDFLYSAYDESQKYSFLIPDDTTPGCFHEFGRYRFTEIIKPNMDEEYFFFGHTRCKPDIEGKKIMSSPRFEVCKYKSETKTKPFFYRFQMDKIVKDANDLRGCSGAPILNAEGKLVSLVVEALIPSNVLFGINLYSLNEIISATAGIG